MMEFWNDGKSLQHSINPIFQTLFSKPRVQLFDLQQKMSEYLSCGVRLGWLINPQDKQVEIYRQGQDVEILNNPQLLSGENVMPGLEVDLSDIL